MEVISKEAIVKAIWTGYNWQDRRKEREKRTEGRSLGNAYVLGAREGEQSKKTEKAQLERQQEN